MNRRNRIKGFSLAVAAGIFLFSLSAHAPFLHSYMHGHSHQEDSSHEDGPAHPHGKSQPCKSCDSCRSQNHFSIHAASAAAFLPAASSAGCDLPAAFITRPVSFIPDPVLGRAPPHLSF